MDWALLPRNIWLFLLAAIIAILLACFNLRKFNPENRSLPVRLYMAWLSDQQWIHGVKTDSFKNYVKRRKTLLYREQLLITWFFWFFIFLVVLILAFGCGGRVNAC